MLSSKKPKKVKRPEQIRLARECIADSERKENSMSTRLDAAIQALTCLDRDAIADPAIQYYLDRKYEWPFEYFELEGTHAYALKLAKTLLSTAE